MVAFRFILAAFAAVALVTVSATPFPSETKAVHHNHRHHRSLEAKIKSTRRRIKTLKRRIKRDEAAHKPKRVEKEKAQLKRARHRMAQLKRKQKAKKNAEKKKEGH